MGSETWQLFPFVSGVEFRGIEEGQGKGNKKMGVEKKHTEKIIYDIFFPVIS